MVEGQPKAPVAGIDDDRGPGVVASPGHALGPGDEYRRDRMQTRVPRRVGVGTELAEELDLERRLLAGLADRGRLERLAVVDEAARESPAGRRVLSLDEDDAPPLPAVHRLDDDVHGRHGVAELLTGHPVSRPAEAIVGAPLSSCQFQGSPGSSADASSSRRRSEHSSASDDRESKGSGERGRLKS